MRISDWSSDVCSSDLQAGPGGLHAITSPAIDAVESGRIRFVPDNWKTTYFQWLNNIPDWCISRQMWWGHRIPAWFADARNVYLAPGVPAVHANKHLVAHHDGRQDGTRFDTVVPLEQHPK